VADVSGRVNLTRILLISANPKVQTHLLDCLKGSIYRLTTLPRWQEDLELAHVGHYDAIVLDLSTDGREALNLYQKLRVDAVTTHLPIFGLVQEADQEREVMAVGAGFDGFLFCSAAADKILASFDACLRDRGVRSNLMPRDEQPEDQQPVDASEAITNASVQKRLAALRPYQAFFENATDGFIIADRHGEVLFVNMSGANMFGLRPDELIYHKLPDVVDAEAAKTLCQALIDAGGDGARTDFDLRLQRSDGRETVLSIHTDIPLVDRELVLLSSRDVTEERRIAHEHRRTKQFFESLIDSSVDAIISADLRGTIILFNKGAEHILGYQANEVVGKMHISRLYPPNGAREVMHLLHQHRDNGVGRLTASRREVLTKSGEVVPISLTAWCVLEDGKEVATAGIFTDLRERLRIEHKLSQAQEKLVVTEKQAMIAELAGATAHELNQPLTSVLGYVELAKRKLGASPEAQHILDVILSETERIAAIVRKLGGITRYETKSYVGEQRIVDLDRSSDPE
jgi:PAS domain S-box-containing protein